MVKNSIKIYARLKREKNEKYATIPYDIYHSKRGDTIMFHLSQDSKPRSLYIQRFKFGKIFNPLESQDSIFNHVARPIINSVLNGYNGTIFAYGQTGSGKTYAITGSYTNYTERGIIPRSIEEIFRLVAQVQNPESYSISISYLEIYNEIGYDLLNPKQASTLEDFPKIVLLEDAKGEAHLRNLTSVPVVTEQEAMRLLYLGDTNRTTAETPMNVYSSRSHCVFTITIIWSSEKLGKIRRSKLHLVDLAGSERIKKSDYSGATLNEARHINLSLHFLEQVVTALSTRKAHIPYRNSMLTYMLRDSLSGNCLTALIATLTAKKTNIEETLATCKFAQRVAAVSNNTIVNEEIDHNHEIAYLRREIQHLQTQIYAQAKQMKQKKLTKDEQDHWKKMIGYYLSDKDDNLKLNNCDFRHIQFCFKKLKETVREQENQKMKLESAVDSNNQVINKCKEIIATKEKEIETLKNLIFGTFEIEAQSSNENKDEENLDNPRLKILKKDSAEGQTRALKTFLRDTNNTKELFFYKQSIQDMYNIAATLNMVVDECRKKILKTKEKLEHENNVKNLALLTTELENQQTIYQKSLDKLRALKDETDRFKIKCIHSKALILAKFLKWYSSIDCEDYLNFCDSRDSRTEDEQSSLEMDETPSSTSIECKNEEINNLESDDGEHEEFLDDFLAYPRTNDGNVQQLKSERPYSNESVQKATEHFLKNPVDYSTNKHENDECSTSCNTYCDDFFKNCCDLIDTNMIEGEYTEYADKIGNSFRDTDENFRYLFRNVDCLENESLLYEKPNLTKNISQLNIKKLDKIPTNENKPHNNPTAPVAQEKVPRINLDSINLKNDEKQIEGIVPGTSRPIYTNFVNKTSSDRGYVSSSESNNAKNRKIYSPNPKYRQFLTDTKQFLQYNDSNEYIQQREDSHSENSEYFESAIDEDNEKSIATTMYDLTVNAFNSMKGPSKTAPNSTYDGNGKISDKLFLANDPREFRDFMTGVPLTGDFDIDDEIANFYRAKFMYIN